MQTTCIYVTVTSVNLIPSRTSHSQSSILAILVTVNNPPSQPSLVLPPSCPLSQSVLPPSYRCRSITGVFVAVSPPFQPSATAWNAAGTWMCWLHHHHLIAWKLYLFVLSSNWVCMVECMGEMPDTQVSPSAQLSLSLHNRRLCHSQSSLPAVSYSMKCCRHMDELASPPPPDSLETIFICTLQ